MFVAAVIPYDPEEHVFTLEDLLDHLSANVSFQCAMTEWRGFSDAIPQLRVETAVPLTIQIEDDPDLVPDEIQDLADRAGSALSPDWVEAVRQCTARLDVQEADTGPTLDPSHPDVESVVIEIARFVDSVVYDNVNDEWLVPEG